MTDRISKSLIEIILSQNTQPFAKILILKYNYNSMSIKALKYLLPLTIYYTCWLSFSLTGWVTWLPMLYAWVAIPVAELFIHLKFPIYFGGKN